MATVCTIAFLQRSPSTASQGSGPGGAASSSSGSGDPLKSNQQPQTLEELLERQWEQGSQFLMEQASHFDSKYIMVQRIGDTLVVLLGKSYFIRRQKCS